MKIKNAESPIEIVWDKSGIPHVFAKSIADAYRGMGYVSGKERLWQTHQSTAYANCEAAALLGEKFLAQDAIQRACNVHGRRTGLPASPGDWIVDAYLDGINSTVEQLDEVPPEFENAGATPRIFTREDVAARYRFTSWFQHKSWTEKLTIGRLMATHGIDYFRNNLLHFSTDDEQAVGELAPALKDVSTIPFVLAYPEAAHLVTSGSNNWAVQGRLSKSGKPIIATDPHQPHTIPNTFLYIHLHAPGWDVFGAAFPGVPYFMMGTTRDVSWGLTTGFVDSYDVYIEKLESGNEYLYDGQRNLLTEITETISIRNQSEKNICIRYTEHGPLLEDLCLELGLDAKKPQGYGTSLHWALANVPTSAGALAELPLAKSSEEFGEKLFENDVCPLVNNIICVDQGDNLHRFIATTMEARTGVTGSVPLPGWDSRYTFRRSTKDELTVEVNPSAGYSLTANNDTMGETGPYYIHNFPTHSARADRISQILNSKEKFEVADFKEAQLDLKDLRAEAVLSDLLPLIEESNEPKVKKAISILSDWDYVASSDSTAACIFYPFMDQMWSRKFMRKVLSDDFLRVIPGAAPGLNRFDVKHFLHTDSPWNPHKKEMVSVITECLRQVMDSLESEFGENMSEWEWGKIHQVQFSHRLAKKSTWAHMKVEAQPSGGSPTTLAMAMHLGPGPGKAEGEQLPYRVFHGPAFRWIVDMADPYHVHFVIAGGNGGSPSSKFATNQFQSWMDGEYLTVSFIREELEVDETWQFD